MYTFANGKVYIGRTSRDPKECHNDHINAMKTYSYNEFADAMREQGEPQYKILETANKEACGGFWREEYEDYAMFTLEQEMLERAEEYVHEEEVAFVKIFFHS